VFDERTVQGAISTVLPKAPLSAREAIGVVSPDDERLRSRAGMAIGKVVVALRQRGHPVGVACATVEGTILAVPYYIDPWAPDPR
jgi:hypothetical protein